jgi:hypothetical protein
MQSSIHKITTAIIVFSTLVTNAFSAENFSVGESRQESQWVKISSDLAFERIFYDVAVDDLESSIVNCGSGCQIAKLTTTPYSSKGSLNIKLHNDCTRTTVKLPFLVDEVDHTLKTPVRTYHAELGSEYCGWKYVDVIVTKGSEMSGYNVTFIRK